MSDSDTTREQAALDAQSSSTVTGATGTRRERKLKKRRRRNALIGSSLSVLVLAGAVTYLSLGTVEVPQASRSHSPVDKSNPCDRFDFLEINCSLEFKNSSSVPRDDLVSQYPSSGFHLFKPEGPVRLVYSSGPAESKFPDIVRQDYKSSLKDLYAIGVEVGEIKTVQKDNLGPNRVVSTSVKPGQIVKNGTRVNLEVSAETVELEDLKGKTREQAQLDLEKLGLDPEFIEESSSEPAGTVLSQNPGADTVAKGSKVTVKVAKAEEIKSLKVPDVVGLKESEAQGLIASAGFTNIAVVKVESSKVTEPLVSSVVPGEGRTVRSDSNVVIVVSIPETK